MKLTTTIMVSVESRSTAGGVIIPVYRPNGRPQYRTATMDSTRNSAR